ncbi:hypothetical protein JQ596_16880 [Bradyrhizobium manausense]|uniref:hypothetical protein n=1 Tax=Bradyrhizobium TaxID=374 RepID=UPI001BA460F2|nr:MULTISPECIES: hypothetical protein [Bradyrhizobium]MBR0827207.1 hypothetical protein [Bradyrhizobium manausense]UVO27058.1 hypothetical protein KUF59_31690 [Bradyrhizobium arachidis]
MKHRRRFKQATTLHDRLAKFAKDMRERAEVLPPGSERDELIKRARNAEAAARIDALLPPPKLRSAT